MFGYKEILDTLDALLISVSEYNTRLIAIERNQMNVLEAVRSLEPPKPVNEKANAAYYDRKSGLYSSRKMVVKEDK